MARFFFRRFVIDGFIDWPKMRREGGATDVTIQPNYIFSTRNPSMINRSLSASIIQIPLTVDQIV